VVIGPAAALGIATLEGDSGFDVWYPITVLVTHSTHVVYLDASIKGNELPGTKVVTLPTPFNDLAPTSSDIVCAYLRVALLSHRLMRARTTWLVGLIFSLPFVVWTIRSTVPSIG
jgi:hypothetical protein